MSRRRHRRTCPSLRQLSRSQRRLGRPEHAEHRRIARGLPEEPPAAMEERRTLTPPPWTGTSRATATTNSPPWPSTTPSSPGPRWSRRPTPKSSPRASEATDRCETCHGATGSEPDDEETPKLNGQWAEYMDLELLKYRTEAVKMPHKKMRNNAKKLDEADVDAAPSTTPPSPNKENSMSQFNRRSFIKAAIAAAPASAFLTLPKRPRRQESQHRRRRRRLRRRHRRQIPEDDGLGPRRHPGRTPEDLHLLPAVQ
jgi:cytochrome c553